jgi:ribosomal protein S18 acetylase RimI-like enzyme
MLGTPGRLVGVAVTTGPERREITAEELARFGYGRGREAVGAELWDRAMAASATTFDPADAVLHHVVPEPHWYLGAMAVEPTQQRQGIGSRLLQAVATRADVDELPVVLLTYQPKNLGLYRRHGYTVVCEGTAPSSELRWWGMRRAPNRS